MIRKLLRSKNPRLIWLSLGDRKSKFILPEAGSHTLRNKVLCFLDRQGVRLEDPTPISDEILDYYTGLLGTTFQSNGNAIVVLITSITVQVHEDWWEGFKQKEIEFEVMK